MRPRKWASVKNWHNGPTGLRATELARSFLSTTTLPGRYKELGLQMLASQRSSPADCALLKATVTPAEFGDAAEYFQWAQFCALFTKSTDGGSERARRESAVAAFNRAEGKCKRTNKRLRYFRSHPQRENPIYRVILTRAREEIRKALGNFSERTFDSILSLARPGGGTALGTRDRRRLSTPFKLGDTALVITPGALPYAKALLESPVWADCLAWGAPPDVLVLEPTLSNRIAFVPKDAKTMRTIAVEPSLNVWLQLGVHEYLLRRLRGVGVDLSSQARNQEFARQGANDWLETDPFATLDLSSASDTISRALVERLLPSDWCGFLDDLRSHYYTMGKGEAPVEYQKWSSMGNGYTFALETLLFWGLGRACLSLTKCQQRIAVYGDDIILPRSAALLMTEVLQYCGLSLNRDKSFFVGPFRESCGEDFHGSSRVVPVYFRDRAALTPTDLYKVVNGLRDNGLWSDVVESLCKKAHRGRPILYGLPTNDGTQCWFVNLHAALAAKMLRWRSDVQAYEQRVAVFRPDPRRHCQLWAYGSALLNGSRSGAVMRCLLGPEKKEWSDVRSPWRDVGRWTTSRQVTG